MRIVLLDEVVFEDQGLVVVAGYHMVDVADLLHQSLCLAVAVGQKVLTHALTQALGLSHVDHVAALVLHQIAARVQREGVRLGLRFLEVLPPLLEFLLCDLPVHLIAQTGFECVLVQHAIPIVSILNQTHTC